MAFCQRNGRAARADLVRICAEIREALEPEDETESDVAAEPAGGFGHFFARIIPRSTARRAENAVPILQGR